MERALNKTKVQAQVVGGETVTIITGKDLEIITLEIYLKKDSLTLGELRLVFTIIIHVYFRILQMRSGQNYGQQ